MKSSLSIIIMLLLCNKEIIAQQKKARPVFHSVEQLAIMNGDDAVSAGIQTVNGLQFNGWFAGIGAGIDFYRYRSVPLFLDVKRYFALRNSNKLFVYADGGYNLPWSKKQEETVNGWSWVSKTESKYKGGAYVDGGFGYAVSFKKGDALLLSIGYSFKYFSEKKYITTWQGGVAGGEVKTTDVQGFTYSFNRLMIKAGWQF